MTPSVARTKDSSGYGCTGAPAVSGTRVANDRNSRSSATGGASSSRSACSNGTANRSATAVGIARSKNATPSASATRGPISLPPAPYGAETVTTAGNDAALIPRH